MEDDTSLPWGLETLTTFISDNLEGLIVGVIATVFCAITYWGLRHTKRLAGFTFRKLAASKRREAVG